MCTKNLDKDEVIIEYMSELYVIWIWRDIIYVLSVPLLNTSHVSED